MRKAEPDELGHISMAFFRPFDFFLVLILVGIIVSSVLLFKGSPGSRAEIYVSNQKIAYFNLSGEERYKEIPHKIGTSLIKYGQGSIQVIRSPCPQKICVLQGAIKLTHERII
jgi:hypothetical protein